MEKYYTDLPNGYKEFKVINAKNPKTILWFNLFAIVIMGLTIAATLWIKPIGEVTQSMFLPFILIVSFGMFGYIVLHELTHGAMYKFFTKQKLTFGFTMFVAFCGVPHIYVNKKVALYSVLAPFVVFSFVFVPILIIIPANLIYFAILIVFTIHTSGCVGDLYVTSILLKSKGKILMNDTGPKQTFYRLEENN